MQQFSSIKEKVRRENNERGQTDILLYYLLFMRLSFINP